MGRKYRVEFRPDEDGYWAITVKGVRGCFTQARSIEQGMARAREALAVSLDVAADADAAELEPVFRIGADERRQVRAAKRLQRAAEVAQERAAKASRAVAKRLTKAMSVRDAGALLGISGARVHQLIDDGGDKRKAS